MASTPPTESPPPSERDPRSRWSLARLSRLQRELLLFGALLLFGLLAMPFIIWLGGNRVLGPYTHGDNLHAGPWALFSDYVVGLAHGSAVFWGVALGPLALVVLARAFLYLLRAVPQLQRPGREPGGREPGRPPSAFR
jgi:hypothetical protein